MMDKLRLEQIEQYVINFFKEQQHTRLLANADIVRALEALEKKKRLLVRHTSEGNDYISLTAQGVEFLGLEQSNVEDDVAAMPHPPKSATKAV